MSNGLYSDNGITTIEQDRFGYEMYASVFVDRIIQVADTPITIGIFGHWGSGKTSLMRLIQHLLPNKLPNGGRLGYLWINAWELSSRDELWSAFVQSLMTAVHERLGFWQRIRFDWGLLRQRVEWLKLAQALAVNSYRIVVTVTPILLSVLWPDEALKDSSDLLAFILDPLLGGWASILIGFWMLVRPAFQAARETVSLNLDEYLRKVPFDEQVSALQQIRGYFDRLVSAWVGDTGRLVIFIDDLDRCTPDKIPEILEAIRFFTNTPRCVYVLGLDYDIIRKGVQQKYKIDDDDAAEYLEKIIQIPFHLPPLDKGLIAEFVRKDYPDVARECPDSPDIFSLGLEQNPRKVKLALNTYRTLVQFAQVREKFGRVEPVNPELLAKIVVIQNRFRDLYKEIVRDIRFLPMLEVWAEWQRNPAAGDAAAENIGKAVLERLDQVLPDGKRHLVPLVSRPGLADMLNTGSVSFDDLTLNDLVSHIFLTGTTMAEGIVFEASPLLTTDLQRRLEAAFTGFQNYFRELGYKPSGKPVGVRVDSQFTDNAYYEGSGNRIVLGANFAHDPDVLYREFSHHVLFHPYQGVAQREEDIRGIESGLADYFPCSYTDDPRLGEQVAPILQKLYGEGSFNKPYIRNLDNAMKFSDLPPKAPEQLTGEVWGGAFWEMRRLLGQEKADRLLFSTWRDFMESDTVKKTDQAFVGLLLQAIQVQDNEAISKQIKRIFEQRGLQVE
ncbi:MAG: hypothetical protein A2Z16_04185 [Chloroflexi bacterium RBG_16_54_18]|nr:MAG: hypothetical protein A2Z16_04185 [Chloroflexi bacterium RBG_16_54_18]